MLQEVLANHKPATWDNEPYGSQLYRRIQVFGNEYSRVIQNFEFELKTRVETVYRVQNPYIYGRYILKVEQLQRRSAVYEVCKKRNSQCKHRNKQWACLNILYCSNNR
jgi:hypothetical protein